MRSLVALVVLASACGSQSTDHITLPEPPPAGTRATLVGPLCATGQACTCREEGAPLAEGEQATPPFKRFEVRVGDFDNDLWVTIDQEVLYKDRERASACFYLDLLPGKHPVRIHGRDAGGLSARVRISELSTGGPWWYDTFEFDCGGGGLCDTDGLARYKQYLGQFHKNLHAPCGSTKVRGVTWRTGRMPDALHPEELVVDLVLDIYEFAATKDPDSEECRAK